MKTLLINPPFQRLKGFANLYFPLGLGYLAAALADEGFDIRIYDAELPQQGEGLRPIDHVSLLNAHSNFAHALDEQSHPVWKELSKILESYQPDVVGITVLTSLYSPARMVTSLCKQFNNNCAVVWGGVHPTLRAEEVLEAEGDVDFVVRGEGEATFKELIQYLAEGRQSFHQIDGLSFRVNGKIRHNKPRDLVRNLDDVSFPRRDLLLNDVTDNRIYRNIMGSRGCAYDCAYCSSTQFWTRRVRFRSIPNIIAEIKHLQDHYDVTELEFWDDSFTLNRKRTIELCETMIAEKFNLSWWCNTRADLIDENILKMMKEAGCNNINIGVETGSEKTLSYLNRKLPLENILAASELLAKTGMDWDAYFMIGFPYETLEDIELTRRLMHSLSATGVSFSIFNPYPGTHLFEICEKEGLIDENLDWSQFSHQSPENHFVKNISAEEFRKKVWEMAEEFDRINKSFRARVRRVMAKRHFYLRNPASFLRQLKRTIKSHIVEQS